MPGLSPGDVIVIAIVAGLYAVALWATILAMMFGLQKRLDRIIQVLEQKGLPAAD